jgi:hypothetical protein
MGVVQMRIHIFRALSVATLTILALLTAPMTGPGDVAHAGEIAGRMIFTASDQYYGLTDRNGTFTGQVTWTAPGLPVAWSFRVSPQVRAIATTPMTCEAGHMQLPYHDTHPSIPADYRWHSTIRGHAINTEYTLYGWCQFGVSVNGQTGTAVLRFHFDYQMKSP